MMTIFKRMNMIFTAYIPRTSILLAAFFVLLGAADSGCHRRSAAADDWTPAVKPQTAQFLQQKLNDAGAWHSLTAHADVFIESEGSSVQASANIIWQRDSFIWVNIKKLGLEVVRALITPDSAVLLNRLDHTYTVLRWSEMQRQYSLPGDFGLLQALLLNQGWLPPQTDCQADIREERHRLSGVNGRYSTDLRLEDGDFRLCSATYMDVREARSLQLQFARYKKLPGVGWFSYLRSAEAMSPEYGVMRLEMTLSNIAINEPKTYRFEIPDHYHRVE